MSEDNQKLNLEDDTKKLKTELLDLIRGHILSTADPAAEEIFMETGVIPQPWLEELFRSNISSEQLGKIHMLMDFIHMDTSERPSEEGDNSELEIVPPKKSENELKKKGLLASNDLPGKNKQKNPSAFQKSPTGKPKKRGPKKASEPKTSPSLWKNSQQSRAPFEKKEMSIGEIAERLFSSMVNSIISRNTLNLNELRDLVEEKLVQHAVTYDPQKKTLTLHNEADTPVAKFSTKELEIILP